MLAGVYRGYVKGDEVGGFATFSYDPLVIIVDLQRL